MIDVEALRAVAHVAPALALTSAAWAELVDEFEGDADAAAHWLADLATETGKPIAVHVPADTGAATVFIAPAGWSNDKLRGWVGGKHAEIEAAFGLVASVGPVGTPR